MGYKNKINKNQVLIKIFLGWSFFAQTLDRINIKYWDTGFTPGALFAELGLSDMSYNQIMSLWCYNKYKFQQRMLASKLLSSVDLENV